MGVRFGVIGLIGSLILTGIVLWISWNFGAWQGLSFVMPFVIMNIFDYSLDYSGVWVPLIIGLWYLKKYRVREIPIKIAI
jgi:hypothetical protein